MHGSRRLSQGSGSGSRPEWVHQIVTISKPIPGKSRRVWITPHWIRAWSRNWYNQSQILPSNWDITENNVQAYCLFLSVFRNTKIQVCTDTLFHSMSYFAVYYSNVSLSRLRELFSAVDYSSRKHLCTKVTPVFHLAYSKNRGNLGSEYK